MNRIAVAFVAIFMLLPGLAAANVKNNLVKCIQQGLLDAGFDPNGVDGAIGNGTRGAASAWHTDTGSDLPELNRNTNLPDLRDWCYSLTPPTVLYGQTFLLVTKVDGSGYNLSDRGPAYVQVHETGGITRVVGYDNIRWENNAAAVTALTQQQHDFTSNLPAADVVRVLGTANRISPDVFAAFSDDWKFWLQPGGGERIARTYAMNVGEDGVWRIIVFNDDKPHHMIIAATAETWGDNLPQAADWALMESSFGITMPELDKPAPLLIGSF